MSHFSHTLETDHHHVGNWSKWRRARTPELEVAQFLKFMNRELWFFCNCSWNEELESENESFFIPFTIPLIAILVLIPQKYLSGPESQFLRIRIVPPLIWTQSVLSKSKCSLVEKLVEKKTFNKILIANRGEVAFRIIRSARRIGINGLNEYATLLL